MKILFPYMARWSSVHASRYYHLLTKVAELGNDVIVLQPPSRGSGEANDIDVVLEAHPRIRVETISINSKFWNAKFPLEKLIKKMWYTLLSIPYIKRILRKEQIDLLYVYNIPQILFLLGKRPTVVFDLADDLLGMLQSELSISSKHIISRFASWCLDTMLKRSDFVICISGPLYDKIRHPRKFIIPNGANIPNNNPRIDRKQPGDRIVVNYVGAFEYSMALDQILDVAAKMPDCDFTLIGTGREFPRIKNLTDIKKLSNVILTGALSHSKAMEYISKSDICLNLFNKTEVSHAVSPLKLFEYLSFQKPVISTRLREIERINNDFLYFGDSAGEIEQSIRYISTHRDEAQKKAIHGYDVVKREFSWHKIAQDFLHAYATTLKH
jgi:glycosyltransferase involved in cell wall biosynthesis